MLPSDVESLKAGHQFIRSDEEDAKKLNEYNVRIARKYYNNLYREYAIIDLSRCDEGKIGLRWRTEQEVISGKGVEICASKRCEEVQDVLTFEVPFQYTENGESKLELVKVNLCKDCAKKLRKYKKVKRKLEEEKEEEEESHKLVEDENPRKLKSKSFEKFTS
jgi:protein FRA10AC1